MLYSNLSADLFSFLADTNNSYRSNNSLKNDLKKNEMSGYYGYYDLNEMSGYCGYSNCDVMEAYSKFLSTLYKLN